MSLLNAIFEMMIYDMRFRDFPPSFSSVLHVDWIKIFSYEWYYLYKILKEHFLMIFYNYKSQTLTSKVKFDIWGQTKKSNVHSLETILDIKTNSFKQSPLVKYATFCWDDFWPVRPNWKIQIFITRKLWYISRGNFFVHSFDKYAFSCSHELWPNLTF